MTLPTSLRVLERGWLSSNNVLFSPQGGAPATLVDTSYAAHAEQTLSLVKGRLGPVPLARVVNTHLHSDHCGGNSLLQRHYDCETWVPESLVAPVATARVDADSGDERSLEDGRADAPAVDVPGAREAHVTRDRPRRYVRAPLGLPDLFFRRVARRVARARPPLGDADRTRRRHAFTLLRSELDRRALGTLGPRGPPAV